MQMPLCFPEKITSGPADIGVMGAAPGIGVNGVANAGGTIPDMKSVKLQFRQTFDVFRHVECAPTWCWRAHDGSNRAGIGHG